MTTIYVYDDNSVVVSDEYIQDQDDVEIWFGNENPDEYNDADDEGLLGLLRWWVQEYNLPTPCALNFKDRIVEIKGNYHTVATHIHTGKQTKWGDVLEGTRDFALSIIESFADNDGYIIGVGNILYSADKYPGPDVDGNFPEYYNPDYAIIDPAWPEAKIKIGDYIYEMVPDQESGE